MSLRGKGCRGLAIDEGLDNPWFGGEGGSGFEVLTTLIQGKMVLFLEFWEVCEMDMEMKMATTVCLDLGRMIEGFWRFKVLEKKRRGFLWLVVTTMVEGGGGDYHGLPF